MNPQEDQSTNANTPPAQPAQPATSADAMQAPPPPPLPTQSSPSSLQPNKPSSEKSAIVALVLALLRIVLPLLPIAAIIVGFVALRKIKRNQSGGKGMAIAAVIVSAITLLLQIIFVVIVVLLAAKDVQSRSLSTQQKSDVSNAQIQSANSTGSQSDPFSNTAADITLRNDLIKAIYVKEAASGRSGSMAVVSITKMPKQGSAYVEEWMVEVGGVKTTYKLLLTPAADGGIDYAITEKK